MTIPTWTAGQVLTASDVNEWFVQKFAYKTGSTDRVSTTTLAADPDLTLAVEASQTYSFETVVLYEGGLGAAAGNLKYLFAGPSGSSVYWGMAQLNTSGNTDMTGHVNDGLSSTAFTDGIGSIHAVIAKGLIVVSVTAGNLSFNWAQGTSSSTKVSLKAGSWLRAWRVA